MEQTSTIAGISTPHAKGGIAMIRVSGCDAIEIGGEVFKIKSKNCKVEDLSGYSAAYGVFMIDGVEVDDGVVIVYRAPRSYTGEDVVELCCHGGPAVADLILKECLKKGARASLAGEFTKRAFLNGKMSLTQAEAINEIINAQTSGYLYMASSIKRGNLYKEIEELKEKLIEIDASIIATLDYPEEDGDNFDKDTFFSGIKECRDRLFKLSESKEAARWLNEGVKAVLIGRPNAGKSTLMNLICGEQKSIVTPIAGTTRDVIEHRVMIGDIPFILTDTAGIRESGDEIEMIGVKRAKQTLKESDLSLVVLDSSKGIDKEDLNLLEMVKGYDSIVVLSKTDMENGSQYKDLKDKCVVKTSKFDSQTIEKLKKTMEDKLKVKGYEASSPSLVTNRQYDASIKALLVLEDILRDEKALKLDVITVKLEEAIEYLADLIGEDVSESVVDRVFSEFCVGK